MGFWSSLLGGGKRAVAQTKSMIASVGIGPVKWMDRDVRVFADEGYKRNNVVYGCVSMLSENLSMIKLKVVKDGEDVPDHPLQKLLDKPNPTQSGNDLFEAVTAFNRLAGNGYLEVIKDGAGQPRELWPWEPYYFTVKEGETSPLPVAWVWKCGDKARLWPVDQITGECDLFQWKTFNPFSIHFGMSPLEAAAYNVDQYNSAGEWNQRLLQNMASPPGMMATEGTLTDAQFERLKKQVEENLAGPNNAGRPYIAEGGLKWTTVGANPKEMDWLGGLKVNTTAIAAVYRVPVQLLGLEGSQTFANYGQARLSLIQDTVLPLLDELILGLNNWLVPMYNEDGLKITYDKMAIPALAESNSEAMERVDGISFMTLNEKREQAGLETIDDPMADQIFIPSGMVPLGDENDGSEDDDIDDAMKMLGLDKGEAK